jgi:hypothetical protein
MTHPTLQPLGSGFDRFLYAPVDADRHGGLLSVISALARLGVDPWEHAAMLARMPVDAAARALAALLAGLPVDTAEQPDRMPLAMHLVSLLPRDVPRREPLPAFPVSGIQPDPSGWQVALFLVVFVVLLLGAKRLMGG